MLLIQWSPGPTLLSLSQLFSLWLCLLYLVFVLLPRKIEKLIVESTHSLILFLPLSAPLFCFPLSDYCLIAHSLVLFSSNPYVFSCFTPPPPSHLYMSCSTPHPPPHHHHFLLSHPSHLSILPSFFLSSFLCVTPLLSFLRVLSLSLSSRVSAVLNGHRETCLHAYININDVNLMQ